MADVLLDTQSVPVTPSSGQAVLWVDSTSKLLLARNDAGEVSGSQHNASIATQSGFSSDTYVTNSDLRIPSGGVQAKTIFRWTFSVAKTAAGVAAPVYQVRIGANRTTADTSRLSITGPAQTAAADNGYIQLVVTVRSVGASGVLQGMVRLDHNLATTGFATNASGIVQVTGSGFDNSALGGQYVGISINGGASAAWTMTQARAEVRW